MSTAGGFQYTGGYHEYSEGAQYTGGTKMYAGVIMSTLGGVQYTGGMP